MTTRTTTDIREAIAAANRDFTEAFARRDARGVASCYASDAMVLPPGGDLVTGADGIEAFWQSVMDMGIRGAALETLEAEEHGDIAHEVGRYVLRGDSDQVVARGKYLVLWRQEHGRWKLFRDIWNSN